MARILTATESADLRSALQLTVLDALMQSRRWEPGQLFFQGGTSLHLSHKSPRFSEDLDFLVTNSLNLESIGLSVERRLQGLPWLPSGTGLSVSTKRTDRNPHTFMVTIAGAGVIGSVKVKVEMFKASPSSLANLRAVVSQTQLATGPAAGVPVFVPTLTKQEIYADKVFALAARDRLKPRDVFDLWWLKAGEPLHPVTRADMQCRLEQYQAESPDGWLLKATERAAAFAADKGEMRDSIAKDLRQWLPSSWPMTNDLASQMVQASMAALEEGLSAMRQVLDERVAVGKLRLSADSAASVPSESASAPPVPRG